VTLIILALMAAVGLVFWYEWDAHTPPRDRRDRDR
jgi:hypothetical protein